MEDQHGDTLLFSKKLTGNLKKFSSSDREIFIRRLHLEESYIRFANDSSQTFNLKFITDKLKRRDTTKAMFKIDIGAIHLEKSRFAYEAKGHHEERPGIDFDDLHLDKVNIRVDDLAKRGDTILFNIERLSFRERGGLFVQNLESNWTIHRQFFLVENIRGSTDHSRFDLPALLLTYGDYKAFKQFREAVKFELSFAPSEISLADVAQFAPLMTGLDEKILFTGKLQGRVDDLKGKDIQMVYSEETGMIGEFNMIGLPDISRTFMFFDINNLTTRLEDLEQIRLPSEWGKITIPENLKQLGRINYRGNFTGFIDDFVAYGRLNTDLGEVSTDISIKPDTANSFAFNGKLRTSDFQVGQLANLEPILKNITMDAEINGIAGGNNQFSGSLEGTIQQVEINEYDYKNIELSGNFSEKMYDGAIFIEDPNIKMNFLGLLDFSNGVPEVDFTANIPRANLYQLNLDKKDTASSFNLLLTANFVGNNLDNLNGEINILNSTFYRNGQELQLYDLTLEARNSEDSSRIGLRSDFIDAELSGLYEFAHLPAAFQFLQHQYLPAFRDTTFLMETIRQNNFTYRFHFKTTEVLASLFFPKFRLSDDAILEGTFDPTSMDFSMEGHADDLRFKDYMFIDLSLITLPSDSSFSLITKSDEVILNENFILENFALNSMVLDDSIWLALDWESSTRFKNSGRIIGSANFQKNNPGKNPISYLSLYPSDIYIRDTLWNIDASNMMIDSTAILVNHFGIRNNGQSLNIFGGITNNPGDTLFATFENLNLANFNFLIASEKLNLAGLLNGNAQIANIYEQGIFFSDLSINNLIINGEELGNTSVISSWNNSIKGVDMLVRSDLNDSRIINLDGQYVPNGKNIDFDLDLSKLDIQLLSPFIDKIFSDIQGIASGQVNLAGTLDEPVLNGMINLQRTSFHVDYLNTRYSFSHPLEIADNSLRFDDVRIFDSQGNQASMRGLITNNNFRNFELDLTIEANRFHFLNTTENNNSFFYGNAIASGIIAISGPPKELSFKINAKTEKDTRIFIPLGNQQEIGEIDYIRFVDKSVSEETSSRVQEIYQVDLSGIQLDFNLEITPDAEAQLIFDPTVGDVIKGRGYGNLKLEINTLGKFRMFGDFEIEEGEYLFTLQNIINKKFEVQEGGKIIWNGDPMNANIDMIADYKLRASLYDLTLDETMRKRLPVDCQIFLTGNLTNPNIRFGIDLPTADEETKNYLRNSITTEEKLINQFLSLVVINSFLPDPNLIPQASQNPIGSNYFGAGSVGVTTSELLSNQLSRWLSQISNDFDIGFNYRPGDEISPNQVEVALSTQLLNDRVSINGFVDVGGYQSSTQTSNIVGDFNVDIKLNKSGKLRLKAFTKANDKLIYELAPYTQGIGLFYREEFDRFDLLLQSYWNKLTGSKQGDKTNPSSE